MKEENKTLLKPHEAYYDIQTSMPILLIQYIFGINYEKIQDRNMQLSMDVIILQVNSRLTLEI